MRKKLLILIISIFLALLAEFIGLYGLLRINEREQKSQINKQNKKSERILKEQESINEETTTEETTEETTTESETQAMVSTIDPSKPMVAMTFDDGPNSATTPQILDTLEKYGSHATFFVVGQKIDGNESIIQRAASIGCEIGNHTLNHVKLTSVDEGGLDAEISGNADRIKSLTGQQTVTLRPPYGAVNDVVMAHVNVPIILWSIDTLDWKTRDVATTISNVQQSVFDGAIILMHDIYQESADAAVSLIAWLNEQGYQLVSISELGNYRRGGLVTGIKYGELRPN
ncbi:MAG: polysaccharide deacetylase family protein [Lachnospiraceae bacterium]|nr:polysaccharide deacetylase family protein [Lachnospiraceae bacterium]